MGGCPGFTCVIACLLDHCFWGGREKEGVGE